MKHPLIEKIENLDVMNSSIEFINGARWARDIVQDHSCVWHENQYPECYQFNTSGQSFIEKKSFSFCPYCAGRILEE